MLFQQHVRLRRRCNRRLPRSAAQEFVRFWRHARQPLQHHHAFVEKPSDRRVCQNKPDSCLASMGIYVFETKNFYFDQLARDAASPNSSRDFGKTSFLTL